jgi:putative transposase
MTCRRAFGAMDKGNGPLVLTACVRIDGVVGMRGRRIKVAADSGEAVYHCMSRTVNGERVFDRRALEVLRKQIWQVAEFAGVDVLTYALLSNHFHVLVRVPQKGPVSDAELLRRYGVLYPKPTAYQAARLEVIRREFEQGGPEAEAWRKRLLALMGDVSVFMKLLKQRFSVWFNQNHQRFGPLWSDRFKSVLVEPKRRVIQTMAAYIDLNAVRAGLVDDPKEYRFCGYAEAVAGGHEARNGFAVILGAGSWTKVQAEYRQVLFGTGAGPRAKGGGIAMEDFRRVMKQGGKLPLATVLRCRVRYFSEGAVLGSKMFVEAQLARYRSKEHPRPRTAARELPVAGEWAELVAMKKPRERMRQQT